MRRERLCLDPRPANGGKDCVGSGIEHAACEITGCSGESLMLMHLPQVYALIRQSLVTPHLCTCMYSHFLQRNNMYTNKADCYDKSTFYKNNDIAKIDFIIVKFFL